MSGKIVYSGQSFLDKVLECTGDVENAFAMALLNGISITDDIVVGQEIKPSAITNKYVAEYFAEQFKPATNLTELQIESIDPGGIGFMAIGTTFIVS